MFLPAPKNNSLKSSKWTKTNSDSEEEEESSRILSNTGHILKPKTSKQSQKNILIPQYGHRRGWTGPLDQKDFCNGGAYPECHTLQYPLGMGTRADLGNHAATLALQRDGETGKIVYDGVLASVGSKKIIHSSLKDMKSASLDLDDRPDEEVLASVAAATAAALQGLVDKKVKANKPRALTEKKGDPVFVKYTPSETKDVGAGVADSRIIRISEAPIDPFEPSRFKHRKVPRAAGSPPPPVLRSPPRKVSEEEQKNWVIPPCISNWKNAKGYTIPLDKRLANDGRGMQDVTINDNFSKLSEALFIADRHAREEVKLRSELATKVLQKEKEGKEEKLRELAQKARMERAGTTQPAVDARKEEEESSEEESEAEEMSAAERKQLRERQEFRKEKARLRERELRKAGRGKEDTGGRDISEKIALGISQPTISKEGMFDQRLFNQTAGISSGYGGPSDAYAIYDKPLFNSAVSSIYKPTSLSARQDNGVEGVDMSQFDSIIASKTAPHKAFSGTDASAGGSSGPVQFEKEKDVFGVDAFMTAAKRGHQDEEGDAGKGGKKSRR